jgi:hypothetical protein
VDGAGVTANLALTDSFTSSETSLAVVSAADSSICVSAFTGAAATVDATDVLFCVTTGGVELANLFTVIVFAIVGFAIVALLLDILYSARFYRG